MTESTPDTAYARQQEQTHDHDAPHAVALWKLAATFIVLLALTFLTVAVTWVDLGDMNIWLALGIAVVKAALVGAIFMHLYWDAPFNGFILLGSIAFVAIFIVLSLGDTTENQPVEQRPSIVAPAP